MDRIQKIKKTFQRQRSINSLARPGVNEFVIVLDQLKPTFNVGKTIRSVEVFGGQEVHLVGIDFFNPYPSKGAFIHVPVKFVPTFEESYQTLRQQDYTLFALDPEATESLQTISLPERSAFVIGHELKGLSFDLAKYPEIRKIRIEQFGTTQSLNACVAASIAMYEYTRQHPLPLEKIEAARVPEISLRNLSKDDGAVLENLMKRSPAYFKCAEPALDLRGESRAILADDKTIGMINFEVPTTRECESELIAQIHLILLEESFQKKGFGRLAYNALEKNLRATGIQKISLGVNASANVVSYWEKMGFAGTGKFSIERGLEKKYRVLQMEKTLS